MKYFLSAWICTILLLSYSVITFAQDWPQQTLHSVWMGTPIAVTVWAQDMEICVSALQAGQKELQRLEQDYSAIRQGSVVNRLNQFAGEHPIKINRETMKLLQWSEQLSQQTHGLFDITIASFKWQYGFGQADYRIPSDLRLQQIKPLVNYKYILIYPQDKTVLFRRAGVQIDFDLLLVSHAFNRLRKIFEEKKVEAVRFQIGTNTLVLGKKPGHDYWSIDLYYPGKKDFIMASVLVRQGKILSEDIYTHSFKKKGKHIHPFLDPRTGKAVCFCLAVTLLLPPEPKLDLPAGVLMLLPPEESIRLVDSIPGAECLLVDQQRKIWQSRGWAKSLKVKKGLEDTSYTPE